MKAKNGKERECFLCKKNMTEDLHGMILNKKQVLVPMCKDCFSKAQGEYGAKIKKELANISTLKCDDCKLKKSASDCIKCAKLSFGFRDKLKEERDELQIELEAANRSHRQSIGAYKSNAKQAKRRAFLKYCDLKIKKLQIENESKERLRVMVEQEKTIAEKDKALKDFTETKKQEISRLTSRVLDLKNSMYRIRFLCKNVTFFQRKRGLQEILCLAKSTLSDLAVKVAKNDKT